MKQSSIPWTELNWDLTKGCKHNCLDPEGKPYCYTRRYLNDPFNPKIFPEKLNDPIGIRKPSIIFVASSGDLLGKWIPNTFLQQAFQTMNKCPQHIFQVLTKNPERYLEISPSLFQPWIWLGTSVTRDCELNRLDILKQVKTPGVRFISFEPLFEYIGAYNYAEFKWAIIGAQTIWCSTCGINTKQTREYAKNLIGQLKNFSIPVFVKPNLNWDCMVREMPVYYHNWKNRIIAETNSQGELKL